MSDENQPLVAVLMGSKSDWETMQHTRNMLTEFGVPSVCRVLSAHRTPHEAVEFVQSAADGGVEVFIAAAGGAAHLAGVVAAHTVLTNCESSAKVRRKRFWTRHWIRGRMYQ